MECKKCLITHDLCDFKDKICMFCHMHKELDTKNMDFFHVINKIKITQG